MNYILKQDELANDKAIAIYYNFGAEDSQALLGTFNDLGYFVQYDGGNYVLDIGDCREIVRISDEIKAGKFLDLYNSAEPDKDDE